VKYLAHLRHGSIIHPDDLATMDQLRAGWNEDSNGGDLYDGSGRELHTCAMTFNDGTEATLLINSALKSVTKCSVLLQAWADAKS
jgi:hypothetical protein